MNEMDKTKILRDLQKKVNLIFKETDCRKVFDGILKNKPEAIIDGVVKALGVLEKKREDMKIGSGAGH